MSTAIAAARAKTKGKTFLKDILNAYGEIESKEDSANAISDWNHRKKEAIENGTWVWRDSAMKYSLPKAKIAADKVKTSLASFVDYKTEIDNIIHRPVGGISKQQTTEDSRKCCSWSAIVNGKFYTCTNILHSDQELESRRCNWHANDCRYAQHSKQSPLAIKVPNEQASCLECYAIVRSNLPKHKQKPPNFDQLSIPGVHRAEATKVQAKTELGDLKGPPVVVSSTNKSSKCIWKAHMPGQKTYHPYSCHHRVLLLHPILQTYTSLCGYHHTTCIRNLTKGVVCPVIVRFNRHGLCQNHYESLLATLPYEERRTDMTYMTPFDPPDVYMEGRDKDKLAKSAHPLAPKHPPPRVSDPPLQETAPPTSLIRGSLSSMYNSWGPQSLFRSIWWQINYLRQGPRIATRIQGIYRGKIARKRVRRLQLESYGRKRVKACILIQKLWRAKQAKRHVRVYRQKLLLVSCILQRVARGFLARRQVHHIRAFRKLCRVTGVYICVRRALRILHERVDIRRGLIQTSDHDRLMALYLFQRKRAVRIIVRAIRAWRNRLELLRAAGEQKFKTFMSALVIQRAWKRYRKLKWLRLRYTAAQKIQAHIRGNLTRRLWADDPGIKSTIIWINPISGYVYARQFLSKTPSPSYSVIRRTLRRDVAARNIQRCYRGYNGRVIANTVWVNMEKRWQWIDPTQDRDALRSLVPLVNYHEERRYHMREIYNIPTAYRGYSYEFQGVLDLIDDRNGLRCHAVPHRKDPPALTIAVNSPGPSLSDDSLNLPPTISVIEESITPGITTTMAVYPIGAMVYVHLKGRRMHPARIVHVHREDGTFDVSFLPGLISMRGIAITEAKNIHVSRLQYEPPILPDPTLTSRIQAEKDRLSSNVSKKKHLGDAKLSPKKTWPSIAAHYHSIVSTIRQRHDVFIKDSSQWMQFVFDKNEFLKQYWLRILNDVEVGRWTDPNDKCPLEGIILPLPKVAKQLEIMLIDLGFQRSPEASKSIPAVEISSPIQRPLPMRTVDDIYELFAPDSQSNQTKQTHDDSNLERNTNLTLVDIHKLVYHLKTLPRDVARDGVLKVTSRNIRTYVCSHPACGRCFSTQEGARLHKQVHSNKVRLIGGDPLVDQYMQKHWPPDSPWRAENQATIEGMPGTGFNCPECQLTFATKRDVMKHGSSEHGREQPVDRISSTNEKIIWLGASHTVKDITTRYPELRQWKTCSSCSSKISKPGLICRLHPSVCIMMESAVIFTTEFSTFAPEFRVSCIDCGHLHETEVKSVYMKIQALCRDNQGGDWAIGCLYHSPPPAASLGEALILGYDYTCELLLQQRLVSIPLKQCSSFAMIYNCSRNYFHRKIKTKNSNMPEKFCRNIRAATQSCYSSRVPSSRQGKSA